MERVRRYGLMVPSTRVIGVMEWPKGKETSIMPTATCTQASFIKIEQMDSASTFIKMDKHMKDFGEMICKMDQERKN